MSGVFVFDACSLIALLSNEEGASVVKGILQKALDGEIKIVMHKVNFFEVYYYIYWRYGEESALRLLADIKISPVTIDTELTDDIVMKAGRLKSLYKMSLADSIGLAEAIITNGSFVTADHHELETVQKNEQISITWIRERTKKISIPGTNARAGDAGPGPAVRRFPGFVPAVRPQGRKDPRLPGNGERSP